MINKRTIFLCQHIFFGIVMSSKLAFKLKGLIEENSLSVQGLEKKAGLKIHAVRNILTGQTKKPSAETLLAVSKALNCSIGELLDEETPMKEGHDSVKDFQFEKLELLEESLLCVITYHKKHSNSLGNKDLLQATEQIYLYSLKNNGGDLDHQFAEWFLDRETDIL